MRLSSLTLNNFRNYKSLALSGLPDGVVAFVGPNGAGKTNLLEAISLLTPGRGLRGASLPVLQNRAEDLATAPWSLHARIHGTYGSQEIGVGIDPLTQRRLVKLNGDTLKNQRERAELFRCIWLTPAMDRIFLDGASARRHLLDRWVFSADPSHAGRLTRYERLMSERNKLLQQEHADPLWLDALEADMAATGLAVAIARVDYLERLSRQILRVDDDIFPKPRLRLAGFLEERIGQEPARVIEDDYAQSLALNRAHDRTMAATSLGPHRSDLVVHYATTSMPASQCSTGEQKALLFALFLAHAHLIFEECGAPPVLLLDEAGAHLDPERRAHAFALFAAMGAQVFLSMTEKSVMAEGPATAVFHVHHGTIEPERAELYIVPRAAAE